MESTGQDRKPSARVLFTWLSVALLFVALVVPVAQAPFVGSITIFSLQDGTAYWFLGFAVIAALATFAKYYRLLVVPGLLVIGTTLFYVYHFEETKAELAASMQGNIFSGLASAASAAIQLQWGVALLIVAGAALIVASIARRDAPTLPQYLAANRLQFVEGGIAVAVVFLGIAVLPHAVPQPAVQTSGASTPVPNPFAALGDTTKADDSSPSPDPQTARMRDAVSVGLLEKGFRNANYEAGTYSASFTAKIQYHNRTAKKVIGVKGHLRFIDQFGKDFMGFNIEYQHDIAPHGIAVENADYDYNQFIPRDAKLRDTPLSRLKVVWYPTRINYADGSSSSTRDD